MGSYGVFADHFWFDGVSFVQMLSYGTSLFARRYAPDLTPLEPSSPATGTATSLVYQGGYYGHEEAANGKGRSLVAYQQPDVGRGGVALKGIFLDNELRQRVRQRMRLPRGVQP